MTRAKNEPLVVAEQGSFFVGGHTAFIPYATGVEGFLSGSGHVVVDQTYVHYQIPAVRRYRFPVIMVHGGGHTGKTYETTPDGREGWATYFVRRGIAVYVVDMATRGRSSFDATQINLVHRGLAQPDTLPNIATLTQEGSWPNLRFGPELGIPFPGTQFPVEAADQYFAQIVSFPSPGQPAYSGDPEGQAVRLKTDPSYAAGLVALLEKIGPSILLTHSQSGVIGWETALTRPELVAGVVDVEGHVPSVEDLVTIEGIPVRVIYGDFLDVPPCDGLWGPLIARAKEYAADQGASGGRGSLDLLPEAGIHGNSHMMMMDRNNLVVADRIFDWFDSVGIGET